jgi:hypothetical protein
MNAAETIQAAIDKLAQQRAGAMQGPWRGKVLNHLGSPTPGVWAEKDGDYVGYSMNQEDADLLVTLHATIDAQIKVLEIGLQFAGVTPNRYTDATYDLARAILDEQATDD